MQFQVPQFIEVEDKIFGPLTFKQFIYVAGGAGACYMFWRMFPLLIAGPLVVAVAGLSAALAFLQFNGRPFMNSLEHGFFYLTRSKLYLWSNKTGAQKPISDVQQDKQSAGETPVYIPKLSDSKLHELAWSLDIKERIGSGTEVEDRDRLE